MEENVYGNSKLYIYLSVNIVIDEQLEKTTNTNKRNNFVVNSTKTGVDREIKVTKRKYL